MDILNLVFTGFTTIVTNSEFFCEMKPEWGVAWIVFQRRFDGSVDFNRNWTDYKNGFGDAKGEYWLGFENIHKLTHERSMEVKLEAYSFQDEKNHAVYKNFWIEDEANYYRLHAGVFVRGHDGDNWLFGVGGVRDFGIAEFDLFYFRIPEIA